MVTHRPFYNSGSAVDCNVPGTGTQLPLLYLRQKFQFHQVHVPSLADILLPVHLYSELPMHFSWNFLCYYG